MGAGTRESLRERVAIGVHDQGPGVAPESLPRLFTRFGSGPKSTGLGLGLFLARGIAEAHGGTLRVHSTLGQGTQCKLAVSVAPVTQGNSSWLVVGLLTI